MPACSAGGLPVPGGYHSVLKGKQGPGAASDMYVVTTVFVRESVERRCLWRRADFYIGKRLHCRKEADSQEQVHANTTVFPRMLTQKTGKGLSLSIYWHCNRIWRLGHC